MSKDSSERFGYEWANLTEMEKVYEWQFRRWIGPISPEFFRGKRVLDAGCGMGRNSYYALSHGARSVLAFDYDQRTVTVAKKTLSEFNNAQAEYRSIYDIDYTDEFDIVLCIGVIEHLEDTDRAITNLIRALKRGGTLVIWVVGNDRRTLVSAVNLLRVFTSRMPPKLLWYLAYLVSIPFHGLLKVVQPEDVYLSHLAHESQRHVHGITFDHLLPIITHYYDKDSAFRLIDRAELTDKNIHHTNNNSWTLIAKKY